MTNYQSETVINGNESHQISQLLEKIAERDNFFLIAHISPDGDSMASCLALFFMLTDMGKQVRLVCDGAVPVYLQKLHGIDKFELYTESLLKGISCDDWMAIAVDCADRSRLGKAIALFDQAPHTAVIDHHVSNDGFGNINIVDKNAAATGEVVYRIIGHAGMPLTKSIAESIYVAVASDTGCFSYSNTSGDTMRLAGRLLDAGIEIQRLQRDVFQSRTIEKTRLIGLCLRDFRIMFGGKLSLCVVTTEELRKENLLSTDSNGIIDFLRDIEGVGVAVFARQLSKGYFKVSMRSNSDVDLAEIAQRYDGGGHIRAAGFTYKDDDIDNLRAEIVRIFEGEFGKCEDCE